MRNRVVAAQGQTGYADPEIGESDQRGADDQMALVAGQVVDPLTGHLDPEPVLDHGQLDLFAPVQGQTEAVETGAQVGAGRRHLDGGRRSWLQARHPVTA